MEFILTVRERQNEVRSAQIIVFSINYENSAIDIPTGSSRNSLKSITAKSKKDSLCTKVEIKEIGQSLSFFGSNVCSVSEKQYERRVKLKKLIGEAQPEFIILLETNLEANWNPFPQIYNDFRTPNNKNCGVLILAKKALSPVQIDLWENKGLCIFSKTLGITVIGIYTPYYADFKNGKSILEKWTDNKKWIAFGDHEHMVKKFSNYGEFNYIPEYSREASDSKSLTDAFYGNLLIKGGKTCHKISDHYILTCNVDQGCKLKMQMQSDYKRSEILFWILKRNSKLYRQIIAKWPKTPLSNLIKNLVKKRKIKKSIWIPNVDYDSTKIEIRKYKERYFKNIEQKNINLYYH